MCRYIIYLVSCLAAMLVPLADPGHKAPINGFPGWPSRFEGQVLRELPLREYESRFAEDFPGRIGRFSDGNREIILRWMTRETRMIHPSSDCFKGLGYTIKPLPLVEDHWNHLWGCFQVTRGQQEFLVKERIFNQAGNSWTDVSSWYWSALWGKTAGPWWSVVVTQNSRRNKIRPME